MFRAIALRRWGWPIASKCSRTIFHAASTASDPPEVKKARFRSPGMSSASRSARWIDGGGAGAPLGFKAAGRGLGEPRGQLDRRRVRGAPVGVEGERLELPGDRRGHLLAVGVADLSAEQARK